MKTLILKIVGAALALGLILVLAACQNPMSDHGGSGGSGGGGSLTISVGDGVSRTLQPSLDMNPASYQIDGEGPGGATFTRTITGSATVTVDKLAFGQWTITVTAFNADGTPIGAATSTATVHTNTGTNVALTVKPYDGFGTLSLDLSWPAADIETAQVESTLLPVVGAARTLTFSLNAGAGTADFSADDISTGYHTLTVKLLDNGALAMGAVELVRIVKDQVTSGSFAFTNVNKPGGSIDVEITPDMGNPVDVSIAGAADTKSANEILNLTANNAQGVNATYAWYVNGEAKGAGSTFAFDDTWAEGYYRIDVTAISADGSRGGSATAMVQVVAGASVASGTALWARTVSSGSNESYFSSVATDLSGNVYAAGSQYGTATCTYGPGVTVAGMYGGGSNVVLVKYDTSGTAQWARTVSSGSSGSGFSSVAVDLAGNIYASGYQQGLGTFTYGSGVTTAGASTVSNLVLVKYNASGTALWARTVSSGSNNSEFSSVAVDPSGNVYAAGYQSGAGTYAYGSGIEATATSSSNNPVLVKYNDSGTVQWARTVSSGSLISVFSSVAVDDSGDLYATGLQYGTGTYTYGPGVTATGVSENGNPVLVKYNASGTALWARTGTVSTGSSSAFSSVAVDAFGDLYAVGAQSGDGTYTYGPGVTAAAPFFGSNVVLVKYSSSGTAQWARTVSSGSKISTFSSVAVDASGNIHVAGYQSGTGTYTYGSGVTAEGTYVGANVVFVKYDASGTAQWARTVTAGSNNSEFYSVAVDASGDVYAAGFQNDTGAYAYGPGVTAAGTYSGINVVLVKYAH